jgi:hypothetical protein
MGLVLVYSSATTIMVVKIGTTNKSACNALNH